MKRPEHPRVSLEARLTAPVTPWWYRLAGAVLCMFGVLIALGLIDVLVAALSGTADKPLDPMLLLVVVPIGAFCLEMGARLVLARRNRHGSLMSPMSWRVLGSVFAAVTAWLAWTVVAAGSYRDLDVGLMGALFAAFCFGIAHHLERREPR